MDAAGLFDELAAELAPAGVTKGSLFGKPCLKLQGKAFACLFKGELVFKLDGDAFERAISFEGATLFDPSGSGRPMKQWVQVPPAYEAEWHSLACEALNLSRAASSEG